MLEIEQQKDEVKLTVTHGDFAADSKVFDKISDGWPLVLSSLKSYLEMNKSSCTRPGMTRNRPQHHDRSDTGFMEI